MELHLLQIFFLSHQIFAQADFLNLLLDFGVKPKHQFDFLLDVRENISKIEWLEKHGYMEKFCEFISR